MMRHLPTSIVFRIEIDEEAQKAGECTALNLIARPMHIAVGRPLPSAAATTELGRAAILLYLHNSGLFNPHRQQEDAERSCEPDLNVN